MQLYQPTITGSLSVSGSINLSGSLTLAGGGTISGTASIATNAITASSADNFLVRNTLTAQTLVVQTITSSVDFVTGSTRFGSIAANTHVFTGSMSVSGSLTGIGATFTEDLVVNGWLRPNSIYAFTADAGTTYIQQPSGGNIVLRKSDSTAFLTIANSGAATFSSNITLTNGYLETPWTNDTKTVWERYNSATYFQRISSNAPSRQLRLESNGAYGNASIVLDGQSNTTVTTTITSDNTSITGNLGIGLSTTPSSIVYISAQSDTVGGNGIRLGNSAVSRIWNTRFGTNTDLSYNLDFYDGSSWANRLKLTYTGQINHVASLADWSYTLTNNNATSPNGMTIIYSAANKNNTSNEYLYCTDNSGATLRFKVASNGGVYNYTGNNVPLSDQRMKKEITPLESYWDKFKSIEMVKFKYIDQNHDDFNIGVVSQQIESIMPEFVDVWDEKNTPEDGKPLMGVYMEDIHNISMKVLQEAIAKIETLQAEFDAYKATHP